MPTNNNPPRPSNPHSEGELHQSELQQKAAPQSLEDAAPNETSTEATNRLHSAKEKEGTSTEGTPADEESQQSAAHTSSTEENRTPQNSNGKNLNCHNFFSKKPVVNWALLSIALLSFIAATYQIITIYNISIKHLEESRKLFSSFSENSDNDLAKIANLRTAAQSTTFHLILPLSILTLCFFNPICAIFKNNIKKTLTTISILVIAISAITPFILYYFKYIGDITALNFFTAFIAIFISLITIAVIFKIIEIIFIFLHKAASDRTGKTYTRTEQSLHYIIFMLVPTFAIFMVLLFVLGVDTLSTALYDRHAYRTTPIFLEEFFNDPDTIFVLLIFLIFSITANLSSATSVIVVIEEIFKNKRRQKAKRIILPPEKKSTRSTITSHIKLMLPLLPLAASIVFMLALIHNTQVTKGNLSTAIQITAIQFTDSKYIWLTMAFSLLLIGYISFIPYFLLPQCIDGAEKIILRGRSGNAKKEVEHIYFMIIIVSSALTFFCTLINYQILKILSHKEIIIFLLATTYISFTLCNVSLRNILEQKYEPKNTTEIRSRTLKETITVLALVAVSTLLISSISSWLIPNTVKGFSDMITSPGDTLGSIDTDYSCIFSNDNKEKSSIAFGVLTEAKPDSVHIFTPTYDYKRRAYGKKLDDGNIQVNILTEAQIKISTGYHVEKFDINKHYYDVTTGKCTQLTPLSFYESIQIKTKLVIRNIP